MADEARGSRQRDFSLDQVGGGDEDTRRITAKPEIVGF